MEISSEHVGAKCRPLEVSVTPRMAMNYAAGTDDPNPWFFDDERPGGIVAPPMLACALTWPLSADVEAHWDVQDFPADLMRQKVHYYEHIQLAQPIVPGQTLRIEGELAALLPHRAGTHMIIRYDARNENNELVFTEFAGAMLREVQCLGDGAGGENIPGGPERSGKSETLWTRQIPIDPLAAHRFDGGSDIHFPIHSSPAFAHHVGLPGILYQGVATLSLAVREITNLEADGDPRRVSGLRCNFMGMVFPGSTITVNALGRTEDDAETHIHFNAFNQEGQRAIHKGCVSLKK